MESLKCYVMRGIPGSGKTTWREKGIPGNLAFVCSADLFFKNYKIGAWEFDPAKLPDAHNWCLLECVRSLGRKHTPVVVDNTNVRLWEIAPYYRLAEAHGYDVEIVHCVCSPETATRRGVHGVPPQKVEEMAKSFDPLPPWWKVRYVFTEG